MPTPEALEMERFLNDKRVIEFKAQIKNLESEVKVLGRDLEEAEDDAEYLREGLFDAQHANEGLRQHIEELENEDHWRAFDETFTHPSTIACYQRARREASAA